MTDDESKECYMCGYQMVEIKTCMLRCPRCGSVKDCSDKGLVW